MTMTREGKRRKHVRYTIMGFGVAVFVFITTLIGLGLDGVVKKNNEKNAVQQYSNIYLSAEPLGPEIKVIRRDSPQRSYWLNFTASRNNGCIVQSHLSLRWVAVSRGQAVNILYPLEGEAKFEVIPTGPETRHVAYHVNFRGLFEDQPPTGDYRIQRLTEFKCADKDPVTVAHYVTFKMI